MSESVREPADSQRWAGMFYLAVWEELQPYGGGGTGQYSSLYGLILFGDLGKRQGSILNEFAIWL